LQGKFKVCICCAKLATLVTHLAIYSSVSIGMEYAVKYWPTSRTPLSYVLATLKVKVRVENGKWKVEKDVQRVKS